jgi:ABC-type transport system substrate-binding protein
MGILGTICAAALMSVPKKMDTGAVTVALDRHWATLHPGLQHTRNGDLVLSNQFDSLVGVNEAGAPVPLGAKSWEILDQFRTLKFKIDRSKRYSDGTYLSAHDYKRSWEESLRLEPRSSNSSLADVLAWIDGFDRFQSEGQLSGIKVVDDETLEVRFTRPFRLALDYLSGNRFSAFKKSSASSENYLGTGNYVIEATSKDELRLSPNPYASDKIRPVRVVYLPTLQSRQSLASGSVDAIGYSAGYEALIEGRVPEGISPIIGQDAFHDVLYLNGLKNRFFEDQNRRLALQWYVVTKLLTRPNGLSNAEKAGFFEFDAQVFLPFQSGRLKSDEASKLVAKGERYFTELVAASKKTPIRVWVTDTMAWLLEDLKSAGIHLTSDSRVVTPEQRINSYYKTFEADLQAGSFSVTNSDPDGVYHALGSHGAITSPMIQRPKVAKLMDEGRILLKDEEIKHQYEKVSRAVLEEVPFVHLGFSKTVSLIRKEKVKIASGVPLRNQGHLHIFQKIE